MRKSRIKDKLNRGQPVLLTQLHLTDPSIFELTSLMGFDGIWMDLEHHTYSTETAAALIRASRVGESDILARVAKSELPRVSRLLEAGAQGIMYARCDTAEEAAEVVNWAKFAPLGHRGFDGGNPDMPYCTMAAADYVRQANEETFLVIQVEDPAAVENAAAIATVPGVDVIFFGPGDFALLAGIPGQMDHPKVIAAVEQVAKAAKKTGKHWGTPAFSLDHARHLLKMGATFISHGTDILMIKEGLERVQTEFASLGFQFRNGFRPSIVC